MLWLYKFIIGFLEVEFSGDITEVILNICAKHGISLWNIKRKDKKIRCFMTVSSFRALPDIARKSGIRVHILKKIGLPFIINRYKRRFGIPVGAAVFFSFLYFMSCFVWNVKVEGNKAVPENEILSTCETFGIKEGVLKSSIDPQIGKQKLLLEQNKLAWASVNVEGCMVTVNVTEAKEKEQDNSIATNITAAADGIITKIDVTSGNCLVKVGDTVAKGQLLVSGVIEHADSTRFVHSSGSIIAMTERVITVSADYKRIVAKKTGAVKKRSVLSFFGINIPLYLGNVNGSFESRSDTKQAALLGKKLPIRLQTKYYEMTNDEEIKVSKEELLKELERLLKSEAKGIANFEVKSRNFTEKDSCITLKSVITAEENIAKAEILLFSTGN